MLVSILLQNFKTERQPSTVIDNKELRWFSTSTDGREMTFIRCLWAGLIDRLHDKVEGLPTPGTTSPINGLHVNYAQQNTTHVSSKREYKYVCAAQNSLPRVFFNISRISFTLRYFQATSDPFILCCYKRRARNLTCLLNK